MSKRILLLILLSLSINLAQAEASRAPTGDETGAATAKADSDANSEATNAAAGSDSKIPASDDAPEGESSGAAPNAEADADAAKNLIDGTAQAGAKLSSTCAACHGPDGNSSNPAWPKLAGQGAPYIYEQLMLFKNGKRQNAIMAGQVANLNEQDMRDLAVYFSQQANSGGVADESLVGKGAKIYRGGIPEDNMPACSGCHGPSGLGNPAAQYPRLSGQHAPYVSAQLKAYRSGERNNYRNGKIMSAVVEDLSDEDIQALATYVEGLRPRVEK